MNLTDLASFVQAVELKTITAAARKEGVPKSTISRRIARLERDLGIELLRRSPRSFVLTDDGKTLYSRSKGALQELRDVEQALIEHADEPYGHLVISVVPDLGRTEAFAGLIKHFQAQYPNVTIESRLEVHLVDLLREGVDIALRMHQGSIPGGDGLMSRSIGLGTASFYAAPDYLERSGVPVSLSDLREHNWITHVAFAGQKLPIFSPKEEEELTCPKGSFQTNDFVLIRSLLLSGVGIGLLPKFMAEESVEQGKLAPIVPGWAARSGKLSLVWAESRHLAPRVRAFVDTTVEHLSKAFC